MEEMVPTTEGPMPASVFKYTRLPDDDRVLLNRGALHPGRTLWRELDNELTLRKMACYVAAVNPDLLDDVLDRLASLPTNR